MVINLYKNESDNRVIGKSLTAMGTLSNVILKDDTNVANPILIIDGSFNFSNVNYIYAPTLDRYYYIDDVTLSQRRVYVSCHVDVLETYKTYLLNKMAILGRSTKNFNAYQIDGDIPMINSNEITVTKFPNSFSGESLILTVAGG